MTFLTLTLNWAVVFHSAVACGCRVDTRVEQYFVVSFDAGLNIRDTTIINFEGFSIEYFAVGVVGAKVLLNKFGEFGTKLSLDGLAELGVVVGVFSYSLLFVANWCRLVLESVIIIGIL